MENLIIKYLDNTISEAELHELQQWLEDPHNQAKFKHFTKLRYNLDILHRSASEEAFRNINKQLTQKKRKTTLRSYLKYAAIFIGVLGVFGYSYFTFFNSQETFTTENYVKLELQDGSIKYIKSDEASFTNEENNLTGTQETLIYSDKEKSSEEKPSYNTLRVPYGKTFDLVLSDGTKVKLNAGSSLRYPTVFNKNAVERKVYLDGEAFFEVEHQEAQPFIVQTDDLDIQVLGTTFNVNAYQEDEKTYAVLVNGKIRAENPKNKMSIDVEPGYKVFYEGNTLQTKKVPLEKFTDWTKGELVLINDSFQIIKHKLERKYDVKINNKYQALDEIVITASFGDVNIDYVLATFKEYKNFNYSREGNQITIDEPKK